MGHIPYGYRIENGVAKIDEDAAAKIRRLYENYLSGMPLRTAAEKAGIGTYHASAKRLMTNQHYLGDEFYPPIIDAETYTRAKEEIAKRAAALGRENKIKKERVFIVPTQFFVLDIDKHFDDPAEQAEYVYSRIECEVKQWET